MAETTYASPSKHHHTHNNQLQKTPQPFKFKLLGALGLKNYLIDKFVFRRPQPQYQLIDNNGTKVIKTNTPIPYPPGYLQQAFLFQDQQHSLPTVWLKLNRRQDSKATVVYSHGNASDLSQALNFIAQFAINFPCFDYVVYDYSGYGRSSIEQITQQSMQSDLQFLLASLGLPDSQVVLWGFSLGSYPTVRLATQRSVKGVILQSPIASLYSLVQQQINSRQTYQNDCFNLIQHIHKINTFVLVLHSQADQVIPISHSRSLIQRYRRLNRNIYCFLMQVAGLKHNQMHAVMVARGNNPLKMGLDQHFKIMMRRGAVERTSLFNMQKGIYFNNIGRVTSGQRIAIQNQDQIELYQQGQTIQAHESAAFRKEGHQFQFDQIQKQNQIGMASDLLLQKERFKQYFKVSEDAFEETVASQILDEADQLELHQ